MLLHFNKHPHKSTSAQYICIYNAKHYTDSWANSGQVECEVSLANCFIAPQQEREKIQALCSDPVLSGVPERAASRCVSVGATILAPIPTRHRSMWAKTCISILRERTTSSTSLLIKKILESARAKQILFRWRAKNNYFARRFLVKNNAKCAI